MIIPIAGFGARSFGRNMLSHVEGLINPTTFTSGLYCHLLGGSKPSPLGDGFSVLRPLTERIGGTCVDRPLSSVAKADPLTAGPRSSDEPRRPIMRAAWAEVGWRGAYAGSEA